LQTGTNPYTDPIRPTRRGPDLIRLTSVRKQLRVGEVLDLGGAGDRQRRDDGSTSATMALKRDSKNTRIEQHRVDTGATASENTCTVS